LERWSLSGNLDQRFPPFGVLTSRLSSLDISGLQRDVRLPTLVKDLFSNPEFKPKELIQRLDQVLDGDHHPFFRLSGPLERLVLVECRTHLIHSFPIPKTEVLELRNPIPCLSFIDGRPEGKSARYLEDLLNDGTIGKLEMSGYPRPAKGSFGGEVERDYWLRITGAKGFSYASADRC
jgi:hypothetical protein